MQSHTISNSNLLEALNLGIYDLVNDISDTKKEVIYYKACGRTESLMLNIVG
ncbi:hypothetical protein Phi47:1_gp59 [Cellulophaga phage phi47:1]|uniref:hypothetical protein n=1 Tax=Cellulophaga phage phiSM TaxID=756280 RepID=UPI0002B795CA|nr:hypothetical protein CEPG_00059 [Cellulophaga phage phiSM]AGF91612.1 hypothetical protein CDPG_00008 [Cellulophaga phage phi47:1]AGO47790.1 hypothetical protein Phi3ST:2_gp59 [Cellulophaga phage phi3ST:2]AGO49298.1 hypothetical protein Phi38:2_gp59 [Cellulophaga phage phi38:2]AGO49378.1 hypothetical protein Phi3:1_gp59 [Cellulophaga phage phi3:1]AGH07807.1 hypothetical protein CEPG_00059 [Cellulophaga phage phiSM]